MRFAPQEEEDCSVELAKDDDTPRSILQVPSLTSTVDTSNQHSSEEDHIKRQERVPNLPVRDPMHASWQVNPVDGSVLVRYRADDVAMPNSWSNYPTQLINDPRARSIPYSPVRIRSSRGAARAPTIAPKTPEKPLPRQSFPVSNRGRRVVSVVRNPVRSTKLSTEGLTLMAGVAGASLPVPSDLPSDDAEAKVDSSWGQEGGTGQFRSALKRKLPLSRKASPEVGDETIAEV
jgi:hypothetical protein